MERWVGNVAVVTGASSGVGYAITQELVKYGMKVAALDRNMAGIEELMKKWNKNENKGKIKGIKCDISKKEDIESAIKVIEDAWGEINVLVNCAGILIFETFTEGSGEGFTKLLETNVLGTAKCIREVVGVMKRHTIKEGHIININSIAGQEVPNRLNLCPYSISKHALITITKTLKFELAEQELPIRVTSICPGHVYTPMTANIKVAPIMLNPEDIAHGVIYALSSASHVNISELTIEPSYSKFRP